MTVATKICGITTAEALDAALDGGADYVGLVFFAKSPRNLDIRTAAALADAARGNARIVALTVDADDDRIAEIVSEVGPDFLQLHGSETPERARALAKASGRGVIKAIPVASPRDAEGWQAYRDAADMILFDAKPSPGAPVPGGNGVAFDWRALDGVGADLAFMLSGGLNPENVAEAIRQTGAAAVDVSSGVETAPGVKNSELIRRFLRAAKTAKQG